MFLKPRFLLTFMTISLVGCGQNAFLERDKDRGDLAKTSSAAATSPRTTKKPIEVSNEKNPFLLLTINSVDLGEINLNEQIEVPLLIDGVHSNKVETIGIELLDEEMISGINKTSLDNTNQIPVEISILPTTLGKKTYLAEFRVKIDDNTYLLKSVITASVVESDASVQVVDVPSPDSGAVTGKTGGIDDNYKNPDDIIVAGGLKFYIKEQANLDFGKHSLNSVATKDVLIENTAGVPASIDSVQIELGQNYSYELVKTNSSEDCKEYVINSCILRVKYRPKTEESLKDRISINYTYTEDKNGVLIVNTTGEIATDAQVCTNNQERIHFPELASEIEGKRKMQLPLKKNHWRTNITIDFLVNEGHNKEASTIEGNLLYVQDAQVYTSFDIMANKELGEMTKVGYYANLIKNLDTNDKRDNRTELFCSENSKTCSGEKFYDKYYKRHFNRKYKVQNAKFTKLLFENAKEGESSAIINSLEFDGVIDTAILDSSKVLKTLTRDQRAVFYFADDIKLKRLPLLLINYKKEVEGACK